MRRMLEVAVWWVLCTGVWLLGLSAVTTSDLVLGIAAGLIAALAGVWGRRLADGHWRPRPRWLLQVVRVALAIVLETGTVLAAAAMPGRRRSRHQRLRLPLDRRRDVADAREALAAIAVSASPGSYVADFDPDRRELLVHVLGAQTPAWARVDTEQR